MSPTEYLRRVEDLLRDVDADARRALISDLRAEMADMSDDDSTDDLVPPERLAAEYRRRAALSPEPEFGAVLLEGDPVSVGFGSRRWSVRASTLVMVSVVIVNGGILVVILSLWSGRPWWQMLLVVLALAIATAAVARSVVRSRV